MSEKNTKKVQKSPDASKQLGGSQEAPHINNPAITKSKGRPNSASKKVQKSSDASKQLGGSQEAPHINNPAITKSKGRPNSASK